MNQAIYAQLCEIADKWFNIAVEKCDTLREKMEEKHQLTAKEIFTPEDRYKISLWQLAVREIDLDEWPADTVQADGFKCTLYACDDKFYECLKTFQKLAKAKEHVFKYEYESRMDFIAEEEIAFDAADAKRLATFVGKDELCPQFMWLHAEYNKTTGALAFFASDKHAIAVMSTDDSIIAKRDEENTVQAHISANDWKRLCDEVKKTGKPAKFYIFPDAIEAGCGDVRIASCKQQFHYPNCQSVMPDVAQMHHFALHDDEVKPFHQWLKKVKANEFSRINVSVYAGNDMMFVDIIDIDHDTRTTKAFMLSETSQVTVGASYNGAELKRLKPVGFYVRENDYLTVIDDPAFDKVLQVQITDVAHTFDVEKREVLALAECA